MSQEFLDGPDVVSRFEQVRREWVPERVATDMLDEARLADGFLHGRLKDHVQDNDEFRFLANRMVRREGAGCSCAW